MVPYGHILSSMVLYGGAEPTFQLRVFNYFRTALSRQCGEAVRIMRRGGVGSVLNSRSKFDRCYILRLRVEEQDKARELEVLEEQELEEIREIFNDEDRSWEQIKSSARSDNARSSLGVGSSVKREKNEKWPGSRWKEKKETQVQCCGRRLESSERREDNPRGSWE